MRRTAIAIIATLALLLGALPAAAQTPAAQDAAVSPLALPKPMTDTEFGSIACIVGAAIAGTATLLAGGVAIVATGGGATTAESAIAVPVLVATVAAGCGVAQSMAPGIAWLRQQGSELVDRIEAPRWPTL
ncbi:hypothetical protein HL658_15840 [Azospirillum sp. RWY-5-1]|uniref:Uncharacterized protein n=1 Tax=Azospirillum oleiclasticum TaxID=2735135 RepID=A0ABX2TAZ0_9PROT|nr:hypothetical protein [Azospirillum oleiclasticum]NYZ14028.1 hypothetical protein [Azospirillum oleiclasticum]NYZ21512.1 hypothetical protein [Azospirillum oleiclasticum]